MKKGTETPINGMSRKSLFRNLSYIVPNSLLHKITAYKNTVFFVFAFTLCRYRIHRQEEGRFWVNLAPGIFAAEMYSLYTVWGGHQPTATV